MNRRLGGGSFLCKKCGFRHFGSTPHKCGKAKITVLPAEFNQEQDLGVAHKSGIYQGYGEAILDILTYLEFERLIVEDEINNSTWHYGTIAYTRVLESVAGIKSQISND
jgi:hypothetical protein